MSAMVIAVDGPAGSGKSSVCRAVAERLGMAYLDTGAMYRALTWAVLDAQVDPEDPTAVAELASRVRIISGTNPVDPAIAVARVDADGTVGEPVDVSVPIRGEAVTVAVSAVSAVPEVREMLVGAQRAEAACAREGTGIVVEGRDITTVVLPDAPLRIFVTADPDVRAQRRAKQDVERGEQHVDVSKTEAALRERDAKDSSRATSPLTQADDVTVLDTTNITLEQSIDAVVDLARSLS